MQATRLIIQKAVAKFRTEQDLSRSEAINLKSLLLKINVLAVFRPLSENFSGMCMKDDSSHRFMLINSNHSRGRQHFTVAHELYHLYIEEKPTPHICNPGNGNKDPGEQCADLFAASLLMPADGLYQLIPEKELIAKDISIATILRLEHYFSVSRTALLYRLQNLEIITKDTRSTLAAIPVRNSARRFGYDTALYAPANEGLVIGDFGEKAHKLFEQEKISEGHYWELLRKINRDGGEEN